MQTDMEIREYDGEERRALNMIWTAAEDHSFQPEFMEPAETASRKKPMKN